MNQENLRRAVNVLNALDHRIRKNIIDFLETGPKTVTDIYTHLRLEQSEASRHLGKLRRTRVVKTERDGKYVYYSLDHDRLRYLGGIVSKLAD